MHPMCLNTCKNWGMLELQPGEKRKLLDLTQQHTQQHTQQNMQGGALTIRVHHNLAGADLSMFGLNAERKLQDDRYFVFYNQLESPQHEISLRLTDNAGEFTVQLGKLPPQVQRLVFVLTHDTQPLSQLGQLQWTLNDGQDRASIRIVGSALAAERALMIAEIYMHNGEWRLSNVSQGFAGGLDALLKYFGGQVAAPAVSSTPTPSPSSSAPAPAASSSRVSSSSHASPSGTARSSSTSSGVGISLADFLENSAEQDRPGDVFELESSKMLEAKVNGRIWSKLGAMIAYKGELEFKRSSTLRDMMDSVRGGGGIGNILGGVVNAALRSDQMGPLASIEGRGVCYLADQGKEITILRLQGDALNVNGNDLLAFEDTIQYNVTMQRSMAGMMTGGLFSVRMEGHGLVALLSHGTPLTLRVTPHEPIYTDPNATIAWSDHLHPDMHMDHDLRSLIGRGGGETLKMVFRGNGFVVVQPYEEQMAMEEMPDN